MSKKTCSTESEEKVYHHMKCPRAQQIKKDNVMYLSKYEMEKRGYRPCRCCNCMAFRVKLEKKTLDTYTTQKHFEYRVINDKLYIKTGMGLWKIAYLTDTQSFHIYHENHMQKASAYDAPEKAQYHLQKDKQTASTLFEAFQYAYKHDQFRKAEKEADGDIRKIQMSKKYRKAAKRREEKKSIRRLWELFDQIGGNSVALV